MIPVFTNIKDGGESTIVEAKSLQQLEEMKKASSDKCVALLFWAEWHPPCHQLKDQMAEMSKVYNKIKFAWCNSDEAAELVEKLDINQVPTVAIFHPHKVSPDLLENPSPEKLTQAMDQQQEFYAKWFEEERAKAYREIEDMVTSAPGFFIFIKGSPEAPKCKFTRRLLELFAPFGYRFRHFDILKDERIRQWLKFYSNWPTFPQIFLGGKFVGGVDIVSELIEAGEFDSMVPQTAKKLQPADEFKLLLSQHKVVTLIDGTIDQPASPQSTELVQLLTKNGVKFVALDMAQRTDLRTALQSEIQIPSLYVEGKFLGDFPTITQLQASGELLKQLPADCVVESLESRIKKLINQSKVMLFMKGSPKQAACGFSQRIVNLLSQYDIEYGSFDIFKDEQIREGLKKYSNWPTYPQLYVNGKLIGGIDICQELHESGELEDALKGE